MQEICDVGVGDTVALPSGDVALNGVAEGSGCVQRSGWRQRICHICCLQDALFQTNEFASVQAGVFVCLFVCLAVWLVGWLVGWFVVLLCFFLGGGLGERRSNQTKNAIVQRLGIIMEFNRERASVCACVCVWFVCTSQMAHESAEGRAKKGALRDSKLFQQTSKSERKGRQNQDVCLCVCKVSATAVLLKTGSRRWTLTLQTRESRRGSSFHRDSGCVMEGKGMRSGTNTGKHTITSTSTPSHAHAHTHSSRNTNKCQHTYHAGFRRARRLLNRLLWKRVSTQHNDGSHHGRQSRGGSTATLHTAACVLLFSANTNTEREREEREREKRERERKRKREMEKREMCASRNKGVWLVFRFGWLVGEEQNCGTTFLRPKIHGKCCKSVHAALRPRSSPKKESPPTEARHTSHKGSCSKPTPSFWFLSSSSWPCLFCFAYFPPHSHTANQYDKPRIGCFAFPFLVPLLSLSFCVLSLPLLFNSKARLLLVLVVIGLLPLSSLSLSLSLFLFSLHLVIPQTLQAPQPCPR